MTVDLRMHATAAIVGALAGMIGSAFRYGIDNGYAAWAAFLGGAAAVPAAAWLFGGVGGAVMVVAAVFITRRFAPEAVGSGIQEIEGTLKGVRPPLRWRRILPVKFAGGLLAMSAGLVLGREGPTMQMGGALGAALGGSQSGASDYERQSLVAAGAGAGLTAAFNAPLGGILFTIEELRDKFTVNVAAATSVMVASVSAYGVAIALLGTVTVLPVGDYGAATWRELALTIPFAVAVGGCGAVFNSTLVRTLDGVGWLVQRIGWLPIAAGVGAGVGVLMTAVPDATGGGEFLATALLAQPAAVTWLGALLIARMVVFNLSYAAGTPGGIFAPQLAFGTLLGLLFAGLLEGVAPSLIDEPGRFALAGMAALLAATVRAPLTALALVAELTGNFQLLPMLLLAAAVAALTADWLGSPPIYDRLLERMLGLARPAS